MQITAALISAIADGAMTASRKANNQSDWKPLDEPLTFAATL
jgi:hypothetical protein